MYKELTKLRKYTEKLDDAIHLIYSYVRNPDIEIRKEDISAINKFSDKLKKKDVYILLEAIYSTSLTFKDNLIKELEEKFSYLTYKWADVYKEYHKDDCELDIDLCYWVDVINEQLVVNIDSINRFCINYLSVPEALLFRGIEYVLITIAHKDYLLAKQRYYELKHNGVNALSKDDHFDMLVYEIDNPVKYVEGLISNGIEFDIMDYDFEFENLGRIEEVVKQDDFRVCFVSERKVASNSEFDDDIIEKVRRYLIEEGIMAEISTYVFAYIIKFKKLPQGTDRIIWHKKYVDGTNLINFFKLSVSNFNQCFICEAGNELSAKNHKITGTSGYTDFYHFLEKVSI